VLPHLQGHDMTGTALTVEVRCPHGDHPMRYVENSDPEGWAARVRRATLECEEPRCGQVVYVEVHLFDAEAAARRGAA